MPIAGRAAPLQRAVSLQHDSCHDELRCVLDERLAATGPRRHTNGTTSAPHNRTYERRVQAGALLSQPDTVIHLHDLMRDPAMIIMTTSDYINDYAAHNLSSHEGGESVTCVGGERGSRWLLS